MPTIIAHAAVPIANVAAIGRGRVGARLTVAGVVAAMLPDADVLAFGFGIPYASDIGHRGVTHSLLFAVFAGLAAGAVSKQLNSSRSTAFIFVAIACASHGLLDMFTNGGLGIAYFWSLISERFFFKIRPVEVSPIGIRRFFSAEGVTVIASETVWIWIPATILAMTGTLSGAFGWDRAGMRRLPKTGVAAGPTINRTYEPGT
jgi:inner membrane protein